MKTTKLNISGLKTGLLSLVVMMSLGMLAFAADTPNRKELTQENVLSINDGKFHLDGEPFAEISFNKFDLMWALYTELLNGRTLDENNKILKAKEQALINLKKLGMRSIRIFAYPWGEEGAEKFLDPKQNKMIFESLDKVVELCEKHHVGLVWCLCAASFTNQKIHLRELCEDPKSEARKHLYDYLDFVVNRYKGSPAVLMWEIHNELTLAADIGDENGVFDGKRVPSTKKVADFYDDVAKFIKERDPLRLINNGGSNPRSHQWNLYNKKGWVLDTLPEQTKWFELIFRNSAIDVIDIHYYPNHLPGTLIAGSNGKTRYIGLKEYMSIADRIKKPLMVGEIGRLPQSPDNKEVWAAEPNYFKTFNDVSAAMPWVQKTLDEIVDSGVQLSHWWAYQSDREMDATDPQRMDVSIERNPEVVMAIVDANKRLKEKLGVKVPKELVELKSK